MFVALRLDEQLANSQKNKLADQPRSRTISRFTRRIYQRRVRQPVSSARPTASDSPPAMGWLCTGLHSYVASRPARRQRWPSAGPHFPSNAVLPPVMGLRRHRLIHPLLDGAPPPTKLAAAPMFADVRGRSRTFADVRGRSLRALAGRSQVRDGR